MIHAFDSEIAEKVGVNAALIYYHIEYYCRYKEDAGIDIYDGKAWTYCTVAELCNKHPYLSRYQIRSAIKALLDSGLIIRRSDLNKVGYDRTYWYSLGCRNCTIECIETEHSECIETEHSNVKKLNNGMYRNLTIECAETEHSNVKKLNNGMLRNLPNNTNTTTIQPQYNKGKENIKEKRFTPPTLEQVKAYCLEKGIEIDCEYFIDYYTANGWTVGKNKMKDWKATVRNWYRRDQKKKAESKPTSSSNPFSDLLREEGYV